MSQILKFFILSLGLIFATASCSDKPARQKTEAEINAMLPAPTKIKRIKKFKKYIEFKTLNLAAGIPESVIKMEPDFEESKRQDHHFGMGLFMHGKIWIASFSCSTKYTGNMYDKFKIDKMKIDRSLISDIGKDKVGKIADQLASIKSNREFIFTLFLDKDRSEAMIKFARSIITTPGYADLTVGRFTLENPEDPKGNIDFLWCYHKSSNKESGSEGWAYWGFRGDQLVISGILNRSGEEIFGKLTKEQIKQVVPSMFKLIEK